MSILGRLFKPAAPADLSHSGDAAGAAKVTGTAQELFATGRFDAALAACREGLALAPDDFALLELAAESALKTDKRDEADRLLRTALEVNPRSGPSHFLYGRFRLALGDLAGALASLDEAIRLSPGLAKAHNSRGAALQIMGRIDEALASFRRAHALDPQLWRASYNIGNLTKLYGRLEDAVAPFQQAMQTRRTGSMEATDLDDVATTRSKLIHDIEQLDYLARQAVVAPQGQRAAEVLGAALQAMEPQFKTGATVFPPEIKAMVAPYYNRLLNYYSAPALPGGALNMDQDWAAIEAMYVRNAPGIAYLDNFLKPEALASLRRFCLESTIWFDYRYSGGYVGCTCEDGFICQLLALPSIFGENRIRGLWGYKYDSEQSGISAHADFAAVNVNFWITPDDANLDHESGGLVIWDKEAPLDWNFDDYNNNPALIDTFIRETGAQKYVVPHRQNRVVLFNSDLFHKTDNYRFKPGYENRRINITMLYGDRQSTP